MRPTSRAQPFWKALWWRSQIRSRVCTAWSRLRSKTRITFKQRQKVQRRNTIKLWKSLRWTLPCLKTNLLTRINQCIASFGHSSIHFRKMPQKEMAERVLPKNFMMIYTPNEAMSKTTLMARENLSVHLSPMRASRLSGKSMSSVNQRELNQVIWIMGQSSMSKTLCISSIHPSKTMLEKCLNTSNDWQAFDSSKIGDIWWMNSQIRTTWGNNTEKLLRAKK